VHHAPRWDQDLLKNHKSPPLTKVLVLGLMIWVQKLDIAIFFASNSHQGGIENFESNHGP